MWTGAKDTRGYGSLTLHRKRKQAHRVAYEFEIGPIPKGLVVLHICDEPGCVNPKHLKLGTQKDNIQDAKRKGRLSDVRAKGEDHYKALLTAKQVRAIRRSKKAAKYLSGYYGVSLPTIYAIRSRRIWKHV